MLVSTICYVSSRLWHQLLVKCICDSINNVNIFRIILRLNFQDAHSAAVRSLPEALSVVQLWL